ncbi:hypothetical protein [Geodermatophilus sp. SYSU D01119]
MDIDDEAVAPFRAVGRDSATTADLDAVRSSATAERPLADPRGGRVLLAGDWHGNAVWAGKVLALAARHGVSTVLQLGDFGFSAQGEGMLDVLSWTAEAFDLTLLVVDGNHEDFPLLERFPVLADEPGPDCDPCGRASGTCRVARGGSGASPTGGSTGGWPWAALCRWIGNCGRRGTPGGRGSS